MAIQFQKMCFTTPFLLNQCGVQPREPFQFSPNANPNSFSTMSPIKEIEMHFPINQTLSNSQVGKLVDLWANVFAADWNYKIALSTYLYLTQLPTTPTYESINPNTTAGSKLLKIWDDLVASKAAWQFHESQGFFIRKTK
ncbi:hypothetical protein [Simkania negevensis]|uniref:Uncharacterized protein n=1 Tax=Simkania negevensis (strain ATCC VR-1471 / DSM 27360 / Z) TaxID=331113 RepID=F8L4H0_SIMNZ|nr:hypothetical protein [Simkania negevensis]MCB1074719.1 hypothetical protein [Simkania sp.]CCB90221.1 unknown protein [Simkania negevensis Z]